MNGLAVLLRKEVVEQWRTARLPVVTVIFLVLGLGSPLLARYTPELVRAAAGSVNVSFPTPTLDTAVEQLTKNLTQFGVIAAILLAMGSVAGEKDSGTAAFVLSKPATRPAFLAARFGGLAGTLAVGVLAAGVGAYLYTALLFTTPPAAGFAGGCLLLLLILLAVAAVTFLGSTLVRSSIPAAGLGLAAIVVAGTVASIPNASRYSPFGLGAVATQLAAGHAATDWAWPLGVSLGIVAACLVAAWLAFRRQEL